jgi:hypothetical protein
MLGVLLAALVLVSVAAAARTATVTVRDASLAPARVRVDSGGSATWRNAGARSHRIASRTGAFAAFTLAPSARKTVRFTRNGAHRYTVDGSRCGIVYVGVALGPACSGGGGGAATPPPTGTRFYNFDVTLRGTVNNEGFSDYQGRRERTWVRNLTWTSTFRNFRFKVVTATGKFIGINAINTFVNSTAQVRETWDWLWHPHAAFPPSADCDGEMSGTVPYRMYASASSLSTPNLMVSGQVSRFDAWNTGPTIEADCEFTPPRIEDPEFTWMGMSVEPEVGTLHFTFERRTGGVASPVGQLVNGRGFTLDTGPRLIERQLCDGDCAGTLKITQRYVATFTPRR